MIHYTEKMANGLTYKGIRWISYRTIPPRLYLGREPAPWCPKPWSKKSKPFKNRAVTFALK